MNFNPNIPLRRKTQTTSRASSPVKSTIPIYGFQALTLSGTVTPSLFNPQPLNFSLPVMAQNQPWGAQVGPLDLTNFNLQALPKGAREVLPKFSGDGKVSSSDHINDFNTACIVIGVGIEDVAIHLFIQTLIKTTTYWFHHFPNGSITTWNGMGKTFMACFKAANDAHFLLLQLSQLKKEMQEPMREFVAKFNKLL